MLKYIPKLYPLNIVLLVTICAGLYWEINSEKYIACLSCRVQSSKEPAKSVAEGTADYAASFETSTYELDAINPAPNSVSNVLPLQRWLWFLVEHLIFIGVHMNWCHDFGTGANSVKLVLGVSVNTIIGYCYKVTCSHKVLIFWSKNKVLICT